MMQDNLSVTHVEKDYNPTHIGFEIYFSSCCYDNVEKVITVYEEDNLFSTIESLFREASLPCHQINISDSIRICPKCQSIRKWD